MSAFEYMVVPAPARGEKVRGAKTPADRYALALSNALNAMAAQGWIYVRAETLPSEERSGLTGRTTVWMNMLVFRRALAGAAAEATPAAALPAPAQSAALSAPSAGVPVAEAPKAADEEPPHAADAPLRAEGREDAATAGSAQANPPAAASARP